MSRLSNDSLAPRSWQDELPVTNRYTLGLAGEKFFRLIKDEGRIFGTRCRKCDRLYVPAVTFCERCLNELDEWVDVGTSGEVETFTLLHIDYEGSPLGEPEIVAFIRLGDGGLIHRLCETTPDEVRIGIVAEAVFKPSKKREGSINDILYFKPVS